MMTVIFLLFILFCLGTAKYQNPFSKDVQEDFLSRDSTIMVNGIFVFLVFLSHFSGYVEKNYKFDRLYLEINGIIGECVVCPFLFYSGYGMAEQIKRDRMAYTKKLMAKRFPQLWIKFAICVLIYIILAIVMEKNLSINQILLSLVGLDSVGNSAWYIFYMLCAYIMVFISFRFVKKRSVSLFILFLLFVIYTTLVFIFMSNAPAYYLVSFVLPLGVFFSIFRDKILPFLKAHWLLVFFLAFLFYVLSFVVRHRLHLDGWAYNLTAICFSILLLIFTLKVKFENRLLKFLGAHIFEIYILQRIPMIALNPIYKANIGGGSLSSVFYAFDTCSCSSCQKNV